MSRISLFLTAAIISLSCVGAAAQQLSFKTEYIGSSGYYYLPPNSERGVRMGNSEGSAVISQVAANIPLSINLNDDGRPTVWGLGVGGAYVALNNSGVYPAQNDQNFSDHMVPEIMNLQLGIYHLRPWNDRWSLMASLGGGVFSASADFSQIALEHILGSASVVFIRHVNPNLDIGGGVAVNSSLGYPMIFPAVHFNWRLEGKFDVNVDLGDGFEISAGYGLSDRFKLTLALELNGQAAMLERDGKDVIFSHQYFVTGLRPEIKFGETGLSVTSMVGVNLNRPAFYSDRTLKGMFALDNEYYFSVSPYLSVGIEYNL